MTPRKLAAAALAAALWAARVVAGEIEGGTVVTILPDRGEKYLSTALFKV